MEDRLKKGIDQESIRFPVCLHLLVDASVFTI